MIALIMTFQPMAFGQSEAVLDKVLMTNGEVKVGHVTEIADTYIKFVHDKETLTYTLDKSKISKIEFGSSGRIEVYNSVQAKTDVSPNLTDHHNKIAVLPFVYVRDGRQLKNDINETKVQQEMFSLMAGHVGDLKIQDPQTTVSLLRKNGVNDDTFDNYMMPEICNMLGVEYVVRGILTINQEGSTTYSSNYSSYTAKKNKPGTNKWSTGSSSSSLQFNTVVDITMYNDHGEAVYTQSKESFWPSDDAYPLTLKYLFKRMPIYMK